eukprot:4486847-Amphidinium_carterae.1
MTVRHPTPVPHNTNCNECHSEQYCLQLFTQKEGKQAKLSLSRCAALLAWIRKPKKLLKGSKPSEI